MTRVFMIKYDFSISDDLTNRRYQRSINSFYFPKNIRAVFFRV